MAAACVAVTPGDCRNTCEGGEQENAQVSLLRTLGDLLRHEGSQISSGGFEATSGAFRLDDSFAARDDCDGEDVPVIDLSAMRSGDDAAVEALIEAIASSCRNWGFFQVINHGVPEEVLAAARLQVETLFNLPLRLKTRAERRCYGESGYASSERPQHGVLSWSEGFLIHVRPESHAESLAHRLGLLKEQQENFCNAIREYSAALHKLGLWIMDLIIRGLPGNNIEAHFDEVSGNGNYMESMEMDLFPSCPFPGLNLGLGSHTDADILTILDQGSAGGLQIFRAGKWQAVQPLAHALCVNCGDMMEILTNGRYISVLHRVLVDKKRERLSVGFIMSPRAEVAAVGPAQDLVERDRHCCYQAVEWGQYREKAPTQRPQRYDYF